MKKIFLFLLGLGIISDLSGQSSPIDDMLRKYSDKQGFTIITISGRMFSMIAQLDPELQSADNIVNNLKSIQILTVSDSVKNLGINFYSEMSGRYNLKDYEELLMVREGPDITRFLIRQAGDRISELLVVKGGPGGNSVISIKGTLSLKQISELSKSMDIRELDNLEDIDKK